MFLTENDEIKLGDLGCARSIETSDTDLTVAIGTMPYISPETKSGYYDFNSDNWFVIVLL